MPTKKNLLIIAITSLILANLMVYAPRVLARKFTDIDRLNMLVDVGYELVENYVEKPDQKEITEAAVRGMIKALNDRYTTYLDEDDLKHFDKQVQGAFSGIGAEITDRDTDYIKIVSPLEDSPAWRSGVMAGDLILEINGEMVKDLSVYDAVDKLTGEEGTDVAIKVRHANADEEVITITRARINVATVKGLRRDADHHWDFMLDPETRIGYIRIIQFAKNTTRQVHEAVQSLVDQDARGLIIDLRFNPGGLLESAVGISDMFLDGGQRIVSIKGRKVKERVHESTSDALMLDTPVVVLGNELSASGSEILAGALAESGRAKYIGTRTFGKGSVQQTRLLGAGNEGLHYGAIKMTTALYYLPSGRNIHRKEDAEVWGVDPDEGFYVPMNNEQIRKMILRRRESDVLRGDTDDEADVDELTAAANSPDWIEENLADPQLAAGLRALLGKIETGDWPPVGEIGKEAIIRRQGIERWKRIREELTKRLAEVDTKITRLEAGENVQEVDEDAAADAGTNDGAQDDSADGEE